MEEIGVLVVDDDRDVLRLTASFLEREGMAVSCAACGEEALRLLGLKSFSLMITDLHMPGMKGFELAGRVRKIAPEMPILMMTGDVSEETGSLAVEAGILRVFAKPVRFVELLETAKWVVGERQGTALVFT